MHQDRTKQQSNQFPSFFRIISLISFLILGSLLAASWISQWNPFIWTMTQYLGPLLFLGIWTPFAASFINIEKYAIKKTLPAIIFGSILVVLGALLLNNRLLFLILDTISGIFMLEGDLNETSLFVVNELIVGIILPTNEEIMKIIPILVVAHAPIVFFNPEKSDPSADFFTRSSIMTRRQFALYGIISGSVFTFLELFLYQWQSSSTEPELIFIQVLFRTLTPVHIMTTFYIALGIGTLKTRLLDQHKTNLATILTSSWYFILGLGFHGLWNTINVIYGVFRPDAEMELIFVLAILGIISDLILLTGILIIFRQEPHLCNHCSFEELGKHLHLEQVIRARESEQKESRRIFSILKFFSYFSVKKLKKRLSCPFCLNPLTLGTCSTCGARTFLTCPHCNGFISETTTVCPHCNKKIRPLIELQTKALSWPETMILGVSSLASIAFLLAPLSIFIFGQMGEIGVLITPILIFYFLMSITTLISIIIALFFNRTTGILVLFCFFLELALLAFIIIGGTLISGFLRSIITLDIIGLGMFCLGAVILFFIMDRFIHRFYHNFTPIFPEYEIISPQVPSISQMEES